MSRDVIEYTGEYAETILETVRDAIDRFCNEIEKHFSSCHWALQKGPLMGAYLGQNP
jgi:hypothetical protein